MRQTIVALCNIPGDVVELAAPDGYSVEPAVRDDFLPGRIPVAVTERLLTLLVTD